jgi:hypothetical protein
MENYIIENLVSKIKVEKEKSQSLRKSIQEQKNNLLIKVVSGFVKEGVFIKGDFTNGYIDIPVEFNEPHQSFLDPNITIRFDEGSFRVDFPHFVKAPYANLQMKVFKVLSQFENEITDIQLDMMIERSFDRDKLKWNLQEEITEDLFRKLLTDGILKVDDLTYEYTDLVKGRMVLNITSGRSSEVKSYFPNMVKEKLKSHSHKIADELSKN